MTSVGSKTKRYLLGSNIPRLALGPELKDIYLLEGILVAVCGAKKTKTYLLDMGNITSSKASKFELQSLLFRRGNTRRVYKNWETLVSQ